MAKRTSGSKKAAVGKRPESSPASSAEETKAGAEGGEPSEIRPDKDKSGTETAPKATATAANKTGHRVEPMPKAEKRTDPPGRPTTRSAGRPGVRAGVSASAKATRSDKQRDEPQAPASALPSPQPDATPPDTATVEAAAPRSGPVDTESTAMAPATETVDAPMRPAPDQPVPAPAQPEPVHVEEPVPVEQPDYANSPAPEFHHRHSLYVVHITPEMAPVAKVGGLADVVFGLTRELAIRGNRVEIILPKYDNLRYDQIWELQEAYRDLWVPWYDAAIHCTVFFGFVHDRKCFFIEPHSADEFFNRGSIYGFGDDVMRYAFFTRAAMEFLFKSGKHPDIIHCHDWQTALAPVLLYEIYQHLGMGHPRVCLTIHNFKHQGLTGMEILRATGLHKPEHFFDYNRLRDNNNPYALNLLKGGIVYSNFVTTVSPRYAFETRDLEQGFGLEPTLHAHHMKYGGVVNGIDYDVWNPEIDHQIPVRYSVESIEGKYGNKRALRERVMLADSDKPIVAFIGRLDPQKGLGLVRHAIFYCLEHGAQFVLLGSSPDPSINADFRGLKQMLNESPDCHLEIGFDENLAHLIYAGADMMLVPSRFEPCGLTQLIALRYGNVPVVRAVGGLADTVFDKDYSNRPLHERNGYVFEDYDQPGLESALGRAITCYFNHPDHFRDLMRNAMRSDYSWKVPGGDYLNIYDYVRHK